MAQSKNKTSPGKMTREQVMSLPELLKSKTVGQIAKSMGVSQPCISYWLRQLDKRGIEYPNQKAGRRSIL